jgi:hypothetical protein
MEDTLSTVYKEYIPEDGLTYRGISRTTREEASYLDLLKTPVKQAKQEEVVDENRDLLSLLFIQTLAIIRLL